MADTTFIDPAWTRIFAQAGFESFDDWWRTEQNLVEVGNFRGSDNEVSWSHVSRIELSDGQVVYLKRQQNHYPNNIPLKLLRIPTFEIEWKNYQAHRNAGIPTMKIVYFASRKHEGTRQCIVVSEELPGMNSLQEIMGAFNEHGWPPRAQRLAILGAIARVIRKMHDSGLLHNALYGRHIYLNIPIVDGVAQIPAELDVSLIDLERTKFPRPNSPRFIKHDLEKMYRRIPWPARECLWFLKRYLGVQRLTPEAKAIAGRIAPSRKSR